MADYDLGRQCSICGAPISDNNPDGIGGQCREVYHKASWTVFFESKDRTYAYYNALKAPRIERFIEELKDTKFRSSFWKSFYPSICEQWNTKGYVSKKQFDIICNRLETEVGYMEMNYLYEEGKTKARYVFEDWKRTDEENEHIYNLANKLRHV